MVGRQYLAMLNNPDPDVASYAAPFLTTAIASAVGTGGRFDYQRQGSYFTGFTQYRQYRDVANFNVGLFMQQTGIYSKREALQIAGKFAGGFSSNARPSEPFGLDPRTAFWISMGYDMGALGAYGKAPSGTRR